MSIQKGLIVYRAPRYQENRQIDIKYGCYSNKANFTTNMKKHNGDKLVYQKKSRGLVRKMDLFIEAILLKDTNIIKQFLHLKGVKKCYIRARFFDSCSKIKELLAIKIIQTVFKNMRYIKHVTTYTIDPLQKYFKTFKNLLLLKDLRSLTPIYFYYSEDSRYLEPFLRLTRLSSKRAYWPHFKSLQFNWLSPEEDSRNPDAHNPVESLKNLLYFLQALKTCKNIFSHSKIYLRYPLYTRGSTEETALIKKISKILPSKTEPKKSISIDPSDIAKGKFDLSDYVTTLQSVNLKINIDDPKSLPFYFGALIQIQSLKNLTNLTINFDGKPGFTDELKLDICDVFSSLHELRYLNLEFDDCLQRNKGHNRLLKRPWLEDAFKAIGKRRKLEHLHLEFRNFDFENSASLFRTLSQSIGKLTLISNLYLAVTQAQSIGDQSVMTLADNLKKLTKLEWMYLSISKRETYFRSNTFVYLMDCLRNSFPLLSSLTLQFEKFQVTRECYQRLYEMIYQMKSLSDLAVIIGGRQDEGVDINLLEAEHSKKLTGWIHCNP